MSGRHLPFLRQQQGATLVVGLIFLAVLTLIGVTAAYGMALAAQQSEAHYASQLLADLRRAKATLDAARPTAVNLSWATVRMLDLASQTVLSNVDDVRSALYAAKICSYAQGMNLLRVASNARTWNLQLGDIARIWKGGCIIRARFLDRIRQAYGRDASLANLLVDPSFAADMNTRQAAWRRVVVKAIEAGVAVPAMTASLGYFDTYRRERLPANFGKPWSEGEDRAIAVAFDAGVAIPDMARKHARTQGSIRLRLEKLGKLPPSGEARYENRPSAA